MVNVEVVGASGYMGRELVRLLVGHPKVQNIKPTSRKYEGMPISSIQRNLKGVLDVEFARFKADEVDADVVFIAAPPGKWISDVPKLLERGIKVITMGGKFRIQDARIDEEVYGGPTDEGLLSERVYGLPEIYRDKIRKARFVTNPGCYPTSFLLGILPLEPFRDKLDLQKIVVNSVSGSSGAGASPSLFAHHPEMCDNFRPYKVVYHRHRPEMEFILEDVFGEDMKISFTPAVANMRRGIVSFINIFSSGLDEGVGEEYTARYRDEFFVRVMEGEDELPNTMDVAGTNFCDISVNMDQHTKRILIISVLDNLGKGGSSQGIQNMNLMFGWDERLGLSLVSEHP